MLTVIYEQPCHFCNWCRRFVERRSDAIRFIGSDTSEAATLLDGYPELSTHRTESIILFESHRHPRTKFRACRRIAQYMRAPWPAISALCGLVPTALGDWGYDLVARKRSQLSRLVGSRD